MHAQGWNTEHRGAEKRVLVEGEYSLEQQKEQWPTPHIQTFAVAQGVANDSGINRLRVEVRQHLDRACACARGKEQRESDTECDSERVSEGKGSLRASREIAVNAATPLCSIQTRVDVVQLVPNHGRPAAHVSTCAHNTCMRLRFHAHVYVGVVQPRTPRVHMHLPPAAPGGGTSRRARRCRLTCAHEASSGAALSTHNTCQHKIDSRVAIQRANSVTTKSVWQ